MRDKTPARAGTGRGRVFRMSPFNTTHKGPLPSMRRRKPRTALPGVKGVLKAGSMPAAPASASASVSVPALAPVPAAAESWPGLAGVRPRALAPVPHVVVRLMNRKRGVEGITHKRWHSTVPDRLQLPFSDMVASQPHAQQCIFLGFSKSGRFLTGMSYDDQLQYTLHLWRLVVGRPLQLLWSVPLFPQATFCSMNEFLADQLRVVVWQSQDSRVLGAWVWAL